MKVYAKDSLDRFGDDLTEEILQYLTFEDKIRLECVSKQWKRCVFNKQFVLEIEIIDINSIPIVNINLNSKIIKNHLNGEILESLLKKCTNIKKVNINTSINSSVLSLIGQYCNGIKSLSFVDISVDEKSLSFFRMYGHKLEELDIEIHKEEIKQILDHCPNLTKILIPNIAVVFTEDKDFLPKLELLDGFSPNASMLKIIIDKYSQTMKTLDFSLSGQTTEELKTCIEYIYRFENLKELKLSINNSENKEDEEPIDDCLSLIGKKCNKLLKLDLFIDKAVPITNRFFDMFAEFKAIKKLMIQLYMNRVLSGSIECFKHCKQLKHLDINYPELREDFNKNVIKLSWSNKFKL